ncbi:hypothetical protein CC80DRAFT_468472 [Byssothecium circinans]|uniref:C2H2-type domain-containing protein n=1 Tax=Byssothecium circinans TaxID=147558 RepID=A0A6A5U269_9PLEO|nr:hypothetical protein CC80DRAFT_468472 [Byssothecium circinans]
MALKRKDANGTDALPRKRNRPEVEEEDADDFFVPEPADITDSDNASDASDDYATTYKDDGTKRALSEARRSWKYVCDFNGCGQRFNRPCRLEAHMRSHNKIRPFVCHHAGCDKTFPRKDHLNRHLKSAHLGAVDMFACDWPGCESTFASNGRLKRHKEVHESKFYCTDYPPCNAVFRKASTLEAHVKMDHLDVKPFPCTLIDPKTGERCTSGYQTAPNLRRHITNVHENAANAKDDLHYCMICIPEGTEYDTIQNEEGEFVTIPNQPLTFATQAELRAHSREVHKPTCAQCGQVFKSQANLESHLKTVHVEAESKSQYPCPREGCDSVFTRRSNLNVHIQSVHDNQYKYFCTSEVMQDSKHIDLKNWDGVSACGDAFKSKSSLEQHIRTHHLGIPMNRKAMRKAAKPRRKKYAKDGVLTHLTGAGYEDGRDVKCLVQGCEYAFFNDGFLRRHLRSAVHNLPEVQIEEMILERNAATGGQFWMGGLDPSANESQSYLDSADPSVPQTPMPYFMGDLQSQLVQAAGEYDLDKTPGGNYGMYPPQIGEADMHMFDDDGAEMDKMMGLGNLPPAIEAAEGLEWDMLVPVQQYNSHEIEG